MKKSVMTSMMAVLTLAMTMFTGFAGEVTVYENVPSRLKVQGHIEVDNAYMWLCSYVGSTNILSLKDLTIRGVEIGMTNYPVFQVLETAFSQVDSAGKYYDVKWWDRCEYHPEFGESSNGYINLIKFKLMHLEQ